MLPVPFRCKTAEAEDGKEARENCRGQETLVGGSRKGSEALQLLTFRNKPMCEMIAICWPHSQTGVAFGVLYAVSKA